MVLRPLAHARGCTFNDDRETANLFDRGAGRAATMRAQLEAWLRSVARSHNGEDYRGKD